MFENPKMSDKIEKRGEPRLSVEVDVIIFSGKSFFRTKTVNISATGCRLADPIPTDFSRENFEIVLAGCGHGGSSLQMMRGTLVDDARCGIRLKPIQQNNYV